MKKTEIGKLTEFCTEAMRRAGMNAEEAAITADVLVTTDSWGVFTHGTKQLRGLLKNYRDGRMRIGASAELVSEGPGWAVFDGRRAMPMVSSVRAVNTVLEKAKRTGIAVAAVRNSGHFGAAGYYANLAAQAGMIGLCMTNVDPGVAVPGSRAAVLGTNPLAYAVPAGEEHPILFDIATSVVAASKVFALRDMKQNLPDGWLVDKNGLPTNDPSRYPAEGALQPMAGHKGYGIALLVEILTGVIAGGAVGNEITSWLMPVTAGVNQSHSYIAIDVEAFMPRVEFGKRMDGLIRQIKSAPLAEGAKRIYLPGEMEWERREKALREGIELPDHVTASLEGLARDYGMAADLP